MQATARPPECEQWPVSRLRGCPLAPPASDFVIIQLPLSFGVGRYNKVRLKRYLFTIVAFLLITFLGRCTFEQ